MPRSTPSTVPVSLRFHLFIASLSFHKSSNAAFFHRRLERGLEPRGQLRPGQPEESKHKRGQLPEQALAGADNQSRQGGKARGAVARAARLGTAGLRGELVVLGVQVGLRQRLRRPSAGGALQRDPGQAPQRQRRQQQRERARPRVHQQRQAPVLRGHAARREQRLRRQGDREPAHVLRQRPGRHERLWGLRWGLKSFLTGQFFY